MIVFYFRRIFIYCLMGILIFCPAGATRSETPKPILAEPQSKQLFAVGDEQGVFVAVSQIRQKTQGVQILYRPVNANKFFGDQWFSGEPALAAIHNQRMLIYYAGGGAQSYTPVNPRTESRIPEHLTPLACADNGKTLYVLARAEAAIELPLAENPSAQNPSGTNSLENLAATAPDTTASPVESPTGTNIPSTHTSIPTAAFDPGDHVIITPSGIGSWHVINAQPLPIANWRHTAIAAIENRFELFGAIFLDDAVDDQPSTRSQLVSGVYAEGQWVEGPKTSMGNIAQITSLRVNQRVIAAVGVIIRARNNDPHLQSMTPPIIHYQLGSIQAGQWVMTDPLAYNRSESSYMLGYTAAATFGQNVAIFDLSGDVSSPRIAWAIYSADGSLIQPPTDAMSIANNSDLHYIHWLVRKETVATIMILIMLILIWRRKELTLATEPSDLSLMIAPWWRRAGAFLIDTMPAEIISSLIYHDQTQKITADPTFWEKSARGDFPSEIIPMLMTYFGILIGYYIITEMLMRTSPGKMMLGLSVRDRSGRPASRSQCAIRNLIRIIECHPHVFPFILLVMAMTRRQQRPGDLLAGTIVVYVPRDHEASIPKPPDAPNQNPPSQSDE